MRLPTTGEGKTTGGSHLPPVCLVPRVIRHAQITKAVGTLIVSQWCSAPFWPLLVPNRSDPAEFILEWLELPASAELILPGLSDANLFKGFPNMAALAIRISCDLKHDRPRAYK